jgi:hypothetical protein
VEITVFVTLLWRLMYSEDPLGHVAIRLVKQSVIVRTFRSSSILRRLTPTFSFLFSTVRSHSTVCTHQDERDVVRNQVTGIFPGQLDVTGWFATFTHFAN